LAVELKNTVYALDATTIDLCLSLFPWAHFRETKGAVRLHTLLDLRGNIPSFIHISDGKLHEVNVLDLIPLETGAFYIMDRGFLDFSRLHAVTLASAFFVIRGKSNLECRRLYSHPVDKSTGVVCDQSILLTVPKSAGDYPDKLRRVKYYDAETDKNLVFLTNNFLLPAFTIAQLYKQRWQVGLFQVDQTAPAHQEFFRYFGERRKDPDLDRHLCLPGRGDHQKTAEYTGKSLHNFTGFERFPL
jgi:hypothetical protein